MGAQDKQDNYSQNAKPNPLWQELANWSYEFRSRWFRKHQNQSIKGPRFFATMGAFVYLTSAVVYNFRQVPSIDRFRQEGSFFVSDYLQDIFIILFLILVIIVSFAYFVSILVVTKRDSDAGPVRAFLSGIALPALVVLVMKVSLWGFSDSQTVGPVSVEIGAVEVP